MTLGISEMNIWDWLINTTYGGPFSSLIFLFTMSLIVPDVYFGTLYDLCMFLLAVLPRTIFKMY